MPVFAFILQLGIKTRKEGGDVMESAKTRSTIGLKMSTKVRLDQSRAPGQCYDGFLCQLVDMWDEVHNHDRPK
ncbi:MAG: hypothetical protein PHU52_05540 [Dehalococcoidales bacterium]|nr:hypothetical protein [Dehalococcoidales bacterium]